MHRSSGLNVLQESQVLLEQLTLHTLDTSYTEINVH